MALKIYSCGIERTGFENVTFTDSSPEFLTWNDAVKFADERNAILQSAREGLALRIEANGQDHASDYQLTRTAVAYVKVDGKWYAAFDDSTNKEQNIILARSQEGYNAHKSNNKWLLPKTDAHVAGILDRAEKAGRIVEVKESPLELATKQTGEKSPFGQNEVMQAIAGDVAEPYAHFLNNKGYKNGFVYTLTPESLEQLGVTNDNAEMRAVGLGVSDYIYGLVAGNQFDYNGRARGVVHVGAQKNSSGNKEVIEFLSKP
ncbi:hypothetical protein J4211_03540 [Candidatus Woesearchaeota archaeon]|nr:hypothetical protein [Candidatus Woesearchaeota archaeon]